MRTTDPNTETGTEPTTKAARTGRAEPTRRVLVCGAVVAAAGATLVACGSDDGDSKDKTPESAGGEKTPASAGGDKSPTGTGDGKTLGPIGDVPVGGGKIYDDAKVVVTQPTAGDFKAFTAVCTHQQCLVGSVAAGKINCPCHGSSFDASTGAVLGGPASRPLAAKQITVANGQVVLKPA
ncbi:Rieske (2Fe-2S) protein [Embleya scabrispora]|uniref:Rieske (2Fe-2S) protein n=1 Tax=Embleya scabrispora TaxID=159449 RepID=UPI00037F0E7B|nr:Rieske (2Fe-2S) protein [Embleya scabrispora]MYS79419.1 Rieske 2Fe-2S domain-containing protein [Streptomyces sp. SID5474]